MTGSTVWRAAPYGGHALVSFLAAHRHGGLHLDYLHHNTISSEATVADPGPKRLVILGGNVPLLAKSLALIREAQQRDESLDISVYQIGWRLGGKALNGRNPDTGNIQRAVPNAWGEFYEHPFHATRQSYHEVGRKTGMPLAARQLTSTLLDVVSASGDEEDSTQPPPTPAAPDNPQATDELRKKLPWMDLGRCMEYVVGWWQELVKSGSEDWQERTKVVREEATQLINHAAEFTQHLSTAIEHNGEVQPLLFATLDILNQTHEAITKYVKRITSTDHIDSVRHWWIRIDLCLTTARGVLYDQALIEGFDVLNDRECRDWLGRHGATPVTVNSELMEDLYKHWFASSGNSKQPRLPAGTAARILWSSEFDGDGSPKWRMEASTADLVFAPLYRLLRELGVTFHFFHRVRDLKTSPDGRRVVTVELDRQATLKVDRYDPLIGTAGLWSWPDQAPYDQLKEGDKLKKGKIDLESVCSDGTRVERVTLQAGEDFDALVIGASSAPLPYLRSAIFDANGT